MQSFAFTPVVKQLPYRSPLEFLNGLVDSRYAFLLESSLPDRRLGRFSFMGCNPFLTITYESDHVEVEGLENYVTDSNPFAVVKTYIERFRHRSQFTPFPSGAVGYFGYDLRVHLEKLPNRNEDDLHIPELILCFYDSVVTFDHQNQECRLTTLPGIRAENERPNYEQLLSAGRVEDESTGLDQAYPFAKLHANWPKGDYLKAVRKVKDYIKSGDIFQANLSQRFDTALRIKPLQLYRRLRKINPSPFAAYLDFGGVKVISSSPERFLKVTNGMVETRPIKGTRPRGHNAEDDARLAQELVDSPKDRAENLMIVDLLRNDLGKVCDYGSVKVPELFKLEEHPTVFHLVSTVTGRLKGGFDCLDLVQACFPGGSVTGAPKIRAMEIIDEVEPVRRGIYTGCIGYVGFNGNMDMNIAIRTVVAKEREAHFHVGSGIVADSDPEAEYSETIDKGRALMQALQVELPV